jgi:hypothetical protein
MIEAIKTKLKASGLWIYNWITVLTGIVVGSLSVLPDLITGLTGIDFSPLVGPTHAAQIVTGTAIVKAVLSVWQSKRAAK